MRPKCIYLLLLLMALGSLIRAQDRELVSLPDIPGYHTLRCDFHMHTVFSDGLVWPTVRVDEAWMEGLDAIAITDHIEYLPHREDITADHNRAWQIAREYAQGKGIIVIPGTEITKDMPPGHLNAIFIKDANAIDHEDYSTAIEAAARQGAFIMWNHPGWKAQQPDTMKWWDEHTMLLENGWLHGIEVANHGEFYPLAIDWAIEKDLSVLGNSDLHAPVNMTYDLEKERRVHTLVFATERSEGGIREALFNGRTLAYIDEQFLGKEALLTALLKASVCITEAVPASGVYMVKNPTDLTFSIEISNVLYGDWDKAVEINPRHEHIIILPPGAEPEEFVVKVSNMIPGEDQCLELPFTELQRIEGGRVSR